MLLGRSFFDSYADFLCVLGLLCSASTGGRGIYRRDAEKVLQGATTAQPWVIPNWSAPKKSNSAYRWAAKKAEDAESAVSVCVFGLLWAELCDKLVELLQCDLL